MSDREIDLTRRKILGALGAVGAAGAGAGFGTSAMFSDTESFEDNRLVAGELDLLVDWQQTYDGPTVPDEDPTAYGYGTAGAPYVNAHPDHDGDGEQSLRVDGEDVTYSGGAPNAAVGEGAGSNIAAELDCETLTDDYDFDGGQGQEHLIELGDVKPGDSGEITFSLHLCDNPGYIWMQAGNVTSSENGQNEAERNRALSAPSRAAGGGLLGALALGSALGSRDAESISTRRKLSRAIGATAAAVGSAAAFTGTATADGKGGSEPTDPDGPNDVNIDNGTLKVNVGELGSGTDVQGTNWFFNGTGTLYRETYGFRDGTGPHVNAEQDGTLVSGFGSAGPGDTASGDVTIPVETQGGTTVTLEVTRNVTLDSSEPTLRVSYDVTNPSGSGATFDDLRLSQYIDYDIGAVGDENGEYFKDTSRGCEFISQASEQTDPVFSGFTGEEFSLNHDLRPFPQGQNNFQSGSPSFNDEQGRFPDSGSRDVTLAMEWSLGSLAPGESTSFQTAFVYNETKAEFEEELCQESVETPTPTPTPEPTPSSEGDLLRKIDVELWYDDDCDNVISPGETADFMLTLDLSGSMLYDQYGGVVSESSLDVPQSDGTTTTYSRTTKIDLVELSTKRFLNFLDAQGADVQVGVAYFDGSTVEDARFGILRELTDNLSGSGSVEASLDDLRQTLANVVTGDSDPTVDDGTPDPSAGGSIATGTYIGEGVREAQDELGSPRARSGVDYVNLVLSDGASFTGDDDNPFESPQNAADDARNSMPEPATDLYTIAVGPGADTATMSSMAGPAGGSGGDPAYFFDVTDPADIPMVFGSITDLFAPEEVFFEGTLEEALSALQSGDGIALDANGLTAFDELMDSDSSSARECFHPAMTYCLGFRWELPREVGNVVQGDSVEFDLGFYTQQCRNNDGTGPNPD